LFTVSFGYLQKLFPNLFAKYDISSFKCDVCELAKSHRVSFPLSLNRSLVPFIVIHSDVWGPSNVPTLNGSRWFVTFIDDCTRVMWACLIKSKGEVNMLFQQFYRMICTQYNA
jgi:hypothetical protein